MRGYKTQNDNTSSDHNVNMDQNCNQSGQSNHADVNPKPSNRKMTLITTIVILVGVGLGILAGYMLFGGDDDNGGNVNNDGNKEKTEENMTATTGSENGHDWVDLGLPSGIKWATTNVGANAPEEYGDYFAWGETSPKSSYDWRNCFDCLDDMGYSWSSYYVGGHTRISPSSGHDTARENWCGSWRMPTDAENEELCNKCKWTWTTKNGHKGYTVTGPNGNSIFLPAAGFRSGTDMECLNEEGFYLSNTLSSTISGESRKLYLYNESHGTYSSLRRFGSSIRPVIE